MYSRFLSIIFLLCSIFLDAQDKVKLHEGVTINGLKQWIDATSNDSSKPLLLFIHGGPGFSSRTYSKKFIKHLKNDFIVAQWDQRNTGITGAWGESKDDLSLELMYSDTEQVINYLLQKFNKEKLYLVGFSWGGLLGLNFASEHPEKLHAYISVSSMIHGEVSEKMNLEATKQRATQDNNQDAIDELSKVSVPFNSWKELYYLRKWSANYFTNSASQSYPEKLFEKWSNTWMPLFLDALKVNYFVTVPRLECPVYFFTSVNDYVANSKLALKYFDALKADKKEMVWFANSYHEIPNEEPKKFSSELIKLSH